MSKTITYKTTTTPPETRHRGRTGGPTKWLQLAEAIRNAGPDEWVIVPNAGRKTQNDSLATTLRRSYLPEYNMATRTDDKALYLKITGPKTTKVRNGRKVAK
jgi:sarcosine oxidase gamma subunit